MYNPTLIQWYKKDGLVFIRNMYIYITCRQPYSNMMYDSRIIRGNTYALHALPAVRLYTYNVLYGHDVHITLTKPCL